LTFASASGIGTDNQTLTWLTRLCQSSPLNCSRQFKAKLLHFLPNLTLVAAKKIGYFGQASFAIDGALQIAHVGFGPWLAGIEVW
jgi:hypothetical protein